MNNNYNSNRVVKPDFAVVKLVDGRAAHMTDTTRHQSWQSTPPPPPPLPDHAGSILNYTCQTLNKDQSTDRASVGMYRDDIIACITADWASARTVLHFSGTIKATQFIYSKQLVELLSLHVSSENITYSSM